RSFVPGLCQSNPSHIPSARWISQQQANLSSLSSLHVLQRSCDYFELLADGCNRQSGERGGACGGGGGARARPRPPPPPPPTLHPTTNMGQSSLPCGHESQLN